MIWKNRTKIIGVFKLNGSRIKRFREPERRDGDEALLKCYKQLRRDNVPVRRENVPVRWDNVPVRRDNVPVRRDNVLVRRDNVPVRQDNVPVRRDNVPVSGLLLVTVFVLPKF